MVKNGWLDMDQATHNAVQVPMKQYISDTEQASIVILLCVDGSPGNVNFGVQLQEGYRVAATGSIIII